MTRRTATILLLAVLIGAPLSGCFNRKRPKPPRPPDPPMPVIALGVVKVDPGMITPRREKLAEEIERVVRAWHAYFASTTFQGVTWPSSMTVDVWVRDTHTNSWEGRWDDHGRYGIWTHGNLGRDANGNRTLPSTEQDTVAAVGHRLCHAISGKGNDAHQLFRKVAGR